MYVPVAAGEVLGAPALVADRADDIDPVVAALRDASDACRFSSTQLLWAANSLGGAQARATGALSRRIEERLRPGIADLETSADEAVRECLSYRDEIERVVGEALRVVVRVEACLGEIRIHAAAIEQIAASLGIPSPAEWSSPPSPIVPPLALDDAEAQGDGGAERHRRLFDHAQRWFAAAQAWGAASERVLEARLVWARLIDERASAERVLIQALHGTALGRVLALGSVAGGPSAAAVVANVLVGAAGTAAGLSAPAAAHHLLPAELFPGHRAHSVWDAPPEPERVAAWWEALGEAERSVLIAEIPWVIGNLPGVDFSSRDLANRELLRFYAQHPAGLAPDQVKLLSEVQRILERERREAAESLDGRAKPPISVVSLDLSGDVPKVAVAYGDPHTASHLTWAVPGMESDAAHALGGATGWDVASRNLYLAQQAAQGSDRGHAVVAWLGYDTPDLPDSLGARGVLSTTLADLGARRLAAELEGARATRVLGEAGAPAVSVLAHSYGTTTASIALSLISEAAAVDAFVMLGSAGLDTQRVPDLGQLRVREHEPGQPAVFTTHARADRIAPFGAGLAGRGQPNPNAWAFGVEQISPVYAGALAFPAEGDPERGLLGTDGHSVVGQPTGFLAGLVGATASPGRGYQDPETQALDTVSRITTQQIDERLAASFARTEAACVSDVLTLDGLIVPVRAGCD